MIMWTVALLSFYIVLAPTEGYKGGTGPLTELAATGEATPKTTESKAPTAADQWGNEADRKITQEIRRAVMEDDALSTRAQNVTIVTQDGKVTLRGTVNSESEKQKIAEKAKQASGVVDIDNQLTVRE